MGHPGLGNGGDNTPGRRLTFLYLLDMKPYCLEEVCMRTCGICSSRGKKMLLKTPRPRPRKRDTSGAASLGGGGQVGRWVYLLPQLVVLMRDLSGNTRISK